MINADLIQKFKMMQTADAANLKSHIGETIKVSDWEFSEYSDVDGQYHNVLALSMPNTREIYRTEVRAFIDKFKKFITVFENVPVEERPFIKITGKTSKKKNDYIDFILTDENGTEL